jgi:recombination protein RecT
MTIKTTPNGQIVQRKPADASLATLLTKLGPEIARALPKHVTADRMSRIALTALRTNQHLADCTPGSFLGAVLSAAQLGLEPNTPLGHCYLIPYKRECTLQIGYQGMLDLARRSGLVRAIYAYAVREGDDFSYELGLDPTLKHVPSKDTDREKRPISHVYAVAKLRDGDPVFTVLTRGQVEDLRRRSRASGSGPWVTDWEQMALKTAIRRLYKWLPKSAEMAQASAIDEAPEIGQAQSVAWDPSVTDALRGEGLEVETVGEGVPHDPETGEVREPGSDG